MQINDNSTITSLHLKKYLVIYLKCVKGNIE
jgi:hypothetical protein